MKVKGQRLKAPFKATGMIMTSVRHTEATARTGSVLLTKEQARARILAGSSKRTIAKKFKHRRSELVAGLQPAGGGVTAPAPDRVFYAKGAAGDEAHEKAMATYMVQRHS